MKKILIIVAALGLIGGAIGFYLYNKPVESMSGIKAEIRIPATELYTAFETDEANATTQYIGKVLEVQGTLMAVEQSDQGGTSLILEAGGMMGGVVCRLDSAATFNSLTVLPGQSVKLRGECTGKIMDVELARCVLISNN